MIIFNSLAATVAWYASVLGGAKGWDWLGPGVVGLFAVVHLFLASKRGEASREVRMILAAMAIGFLVDAALVTLGATKFPMANSQALPPVWLIGLWVNSAMTLNYSLAIVGRRPLVALVFGTVAGPIAYWFGQWFGALQLGEPHFRSVALIAAGFAVAFPLLTWIGSSPAIQASPAVGLSDQSAPA